MENTNGYSKILNDYNQILKVKEPKFKLGYPFVFMDDEGIAKTMKELDLLYSNESYIKTDDNKKNKKGGNAEAYGNVTILTF